MDEIPRIGVEDVNLGEMVLIGFPVSLGERGQLHRFVKRQLASGRGMSRGSWRLSSLAISGVSTTKHQMIVGSRHNDAGLHCPSLCILLTRLTIL